MPARLISASHLKTSVQRRTRLRPSASACRPPLATLRMQEAVQHLARARLRRSACWPLRRCRRSRRRHRKHRRRRRRRRRQRSESRRRHRLPCMRSPPPRPDAFPRRSRPRCRRHPVPEPLWCPPPPTWRMSPPSSGARTAHVPMISCARPFPLASFPLCLAHFRSFALAHFQLARPSALPLSPGGSGRRRQLDANCLLQ